MNRRRLRRVAFFIATPCIISVPLATLALWSNWFSKADPREQNTTDISRPINTSRFDLERYSRKGYASTFQVGNETFYCWTSGLSYAVVNDVDVFIAASSRDSIMAKLSQIVIKCSTIGGSRSIVTVLPKEDGLIDCKSVDGYFVFRIGACFGADAEHTNKLNVGTHVISVSILVSDGIAPIIFDLRPVEVVLYRR